MLSAVVAAAQAQGFQVSWQTALTILSFAALAGSGLAVFRSSANGAALKAANASVDTLLKARQIDRDEATAEASRLAKAQADQERKCREDIAELTGQVKVLTSDTLDRLVAAATTAMTAAMHDVQGETMDMLNRLDQKLTVGVQTAERIEAANAIVAADLQQSHERADSVGPGHQPGAASDAALRSDPNGGK